MPTSRIKYVDSFRSRHGQEIIYYRPSKKSKTRIRLRGPIGSPEFWEDYLAASTGAAIKHKKTPRKQTGTISWVIAKYKKSSHWRSGISQSTRDTRTNLLDRFCEKYGESLLKDLEPKFLYKIQDARSETPHAVNNTFKALKPALDYAVREGFIKQNPLREIKKLKGRNPDGWRAWTHKEIEQFEAYYPIGTRERLAYELVRHTGQRRSDIHLLGKQHEKDGWLQFTQFKGRNTKPQHMEIPIFDELRAVLDASPTGDMTYLVSSHGTPYTRESFGNWFGDAVRAAGLSGISLHGLRKRFAADQAESQSTTKEIMALGGWDNIQQVELYTKSAERKKMAKNVQARRKKVQK